MRSEQEITAELNQLQSVVQSLMKIAGNTPAGSPEFVQAGNELLKATMLMSALEWVKGEPELETLTDLVEL